MLSIGQNSTTNDQADRIRRSTPQPINEEIDRQTDENIRRFSEMGRNAILLRIDALDREWDVDRMLEVNAPPRLPCPVWYLG